MKMESITVYSLSYWGWKLPPPPPQWQKNAMTRHQMLQWSLQAQQPFGLTHKMLSDTASTPALSETAVMSHILLLGIWNAMVMKRDVPLRVKHTGFQRAHEKKENYFIGIFYANYVHKCWMLLFWIYWVKLKLMPPVLTLKTVLAEN